MYYMHIYLCVCVCERESARARAMIERERVCVCMDFFFVHETYCVVVWEHHLFKQLKQQRLALADGLNKVWPNPNDLP